MADSHDNLQAIRRAIHFFRNTECEFLIHAGDFVAPFSALELEALKFPVKAVFGNCDGEKQGLKKAFRSLGEIKEAPFAFTHNNLRFLITHIHSSLKRYLTSGKHDIIIFGHTHKPEIKKEKASLLINPGEAGGWLSGKSTVALLDPRSLKAEIVNL